MHIHRSLTGALLVGSLLFSATLRAQAPSPQTLEEANAQRARAEQMRDAAERNFLVEQDACYDKFQVSSCIDSAKKRRTQALIDARNFDIPAREFQREAKRAEVDAKEQKRDVDAPRRAAEQQQQAAEFRAEETAKLQAQAAIETAAKTEAPSASPDPVAEAKVPETVIQQAQVAHVNESSHDGDALTLGQINSLIAPLKIDAAGLEQLGFMPSKTVKAAKHYQASSIPAMVQAMLTHLQGVLATA